jgi:hypothetical protein
MEETTSRTLGEMLEAQRLAIRARRMERVIDALRDREVQRRRSGPVPPPLQHAIRDFRRELGTINAQLSALRSERA